MYSPQGAGPSGRSVGGVHVPLSGNIDTAYQKYSEHVEYGHMEETCRCNPTEYGHPMDCRDDEVGGRFLEDNLTVSGGGRAASHLSGDLCKSL